MPRPLTSFAIAHPYTYPLSLRPPNTRIKLILPTQSQLGSHDSELAIVLNDTDLIQSTMDGQPYCAGRHVSHLRRTLWLEHLGMLPAQDPDASNDPNAQPPIVDGVEIPNVSIDELSSPENNEFIADPLSAALWETWTTRATDNTRTYRYLFRADPDDHIKTFEDFDNFSPRGKIKQGHLHDPFVPVEDVKRKLDDIKGHLVWMPLDFLKDADMATPGLSVNQFTEVCAPFILKTIKVESANCFGRVFILRDGKPPWRAVQVGDELVFRDLYAQN